MTCRPPAASRGTSVSNAPLGVTSNRTQPVSRPRTVRQAGAAYPGRCSPRISLRKPADTPDSSGQVATGVRRRWPTGAAGPTSSMTGNRMSEAAARDAVHHAAGATGHCDRHDLPQFTGPLEQRKSHARQYRSGHRSIACIAYGSAGHGGRVTALRSSARSARPPAPLRRPAVAVQAHQVARGRAGCSAVRSPASPGSDSPMRAWRKSDRPGRPSVSQDGAGTPWPRWWACTGARSG